MEQKITIAVPRDMDVTVTVAPHQAERAFNPFDYWSFGKNDPLPVWLKPDATPEERAQMPPAWAEAKARAVKVLNGS